MHKMSGDHDMQNTMNKLFCKIRNGTAPTYRPDLIRTLNAPYYVKDHNKCILLEYNSQI